MNRSLTIRLFATFFFVFIVSLAPMTAQAANSGFFGPIVPDACNCPHGAADYGCVLATIQNAINFAITLGCVAAALALVYAGFVWMTSVGNPEKVSQGRAMFINVMIGLAIVLSAWLIIDFIMKKLYNSGSSYGPWNSILADTSGSMCITAKPQQVIPGLLGSFSTGILGGGGGGGTGGAGDVGYYPPSANVGTDHLNTASALQYLTSHYTGSEGTGHCLTAIQLSFSAAGKSLSCPSGYAGKCNSSLRDMGFQSLGTSDSNPQPGDIVVIQHINGKDSIGHIAMFTGTHWVSDFVQSNSEVPPGNPYPANQFGGAQYWRP